MARCTNCGSDEHAARRCPTRKRSGKSGKHKRKDRLVRAFDCETTSAGVVLFLAADARRQVSYQYRAEGLGLAEMLDWLIEHGQGSLNVGFYFDYDAGQVIRLLPHSFQAQLATRGRVQWRQYRFHHVPKKRLTLTDTARGRSMTIWDVASWAQGSFLKLCTDWSLGTEAERAEVAAMKARRGTFEDASEHELVSYTTLECALLAGWVEDLIRLHEECGIHLRAYSGPGSTASAMLRQHGWKPPAVPAEVQRVAESAFFGGRSEISSIGPIAGPVHSYDVNSAYPTAIAQLPEIAGARWRRVRKWTPGAWGFYHVRWRQPRTDVWGLFPMRGARLPDGRRSISLLYPLHGQGWFHSWEVEAALEVRPDAVEIISGLVIDDTGRPFDWIRETTARRLEYKAAGDPRAFPLKVGCNSCYGKLAQRSGTAPLQCMTYAAAITAHTRGLLLRQAVRHQSSVVLLATDGILSTEPLAVEIGAELGQWEYHEYEDAWLLQAGVYWAGKKKRTRGIDARELSREAVEAAWEAKRTRAEISLTTTRVLSYRLCYAQNKLEESGTWSKGTRVAKFSPAPRRRKWKWKDGRLFTLPAEVEHYQMTAALDSAFMDPTQGYDDSEALPEWLQD